MSTAEKVAAHNERLLDAAFKRHWKRLSRAVLHMEQVGTADGEGQIVALDGANAWVHIDGSRNPTAYNLTEVTPLTP